MNEKLKNVVDELINNAEKNQLPNIDEINALKGVVELLDSINIDKLIELDTKFSSKKP